MPYSMYDDIRNDPVLGNLVKALEPTKEERIEGYVKNCGCPATIDDHTDGFANIVLFLCHYFRFCPNCMMLRVIHWRKILLILLSLMQLSIILVSDDEWKRLSRKLKSNQYNRFPIDNRMAYIIFPSDVGIDADSSMPLTVDMVNSDDFMRTLLMTREKTKVSGNIDESYQPLKKILRVDNDIPFEIESDNKNVPVSASLTTTTATVTIENDRQFVETDEEQQEPVKKNTSQSNGSGGSSKEEHITALHDWPKSEETVEITIKKTVVVCSVDELVQICADVIEETKHFNPDKDSIQDALNARHELRIEIIRQKGLEYKVVSAKTKEIPVRSIDWSSTRHMDREQIVAKIKSKIDLSPH